MHISQGTMPSFVLNTTRWRSYYRDELRRRGGPRGSSTGSASQRWVPRDNNARLIPVLPDVPSTMVPPGFKRPAFSASRIICRATRSLLLPPGFCHSALAWEKRNHTTRRPTDPSHSDTGTWHAPHNFRTKDINRHVQEEHSRTWGATRDGEAAVRRQPNSLLHARGTAQSGSGTHIDLASGGVGEAVDANKSGVANQRREAFQLFLRIRSAPFGHKLATWTTGSATSTAHSTDASTCGSPRSVSMASLRH